MSAIFANRLKSERESKGWTQEQFAEILGVSNGTVSGYERNYREPDFDTLIKIARQLNVSIDYLLGNSDIRNPLIEHIESLDVSISRDLSLHKNSDQLITRITELITRSKRKMTKKEGDFVLAIIKEYIEILKTTKKHLLKLSPKNFTSPG